MILKLVIETLYILILAAIGIWDQKKQKISDKMLVILLIAGIGICFFNPKVTMAQRLEGALLFASPLLLSAVIKPGGFGGGDIKLAAIAGMTIGISGVPMAIMTALVGAAVYGCALVLFQGKKRTDYFAFGPFLCIGIILVFVYQIIG